MSAVIGGRRSLVYVGRPHVEGHRGDLEAEADHEEAETHEEEWIAPGAAGDRDADAVEVRGAGGAEDERDAVEEEAGREGAEEEVLHRRLGRLDAALEGPRQHVQGEGHRLEPQEHDDEVSRARHQRHAHRGEEHEDVELARLRALPAYVVEREEKNEPHREADDEVEEDREAVEDHHALERLLVGAPEVERGHQREHHPARPTTPRCSFRCARRQEVDHQQHERGHGEDEHGPDGPEADDGRDERGRHRVSARRGPRWRRPWPGPGSRGPGRSPPSARGRAPGRRRSTR